MPLIVRDLPPIFISSGSSVNTVPTGHLDDALAITIFISTLNNTVSSNLSVQVCPFDPADVYSSQGIVSASSAFYTLTTAISSGTGAFTFENISWRGMRIVTWLPSG